MENNLWVRIGEVVVTTILISFFGYLINNINNLQSVMNNLSSEIAIKTDRLSVVESNIKERNSFLETLKEENAAHKEKLNSLDNLIEQLQKENTEFDNDFHSLKERVILLEVKK